MSLIHVILVLGHQPCFFFSFLQEIKAFVPVKVTALLRICNVF